MPRGDRTGPNGMGPMTGRAAGYCSGAMAPGSRAYGGGAGFGAGRGRGAGCRGFSGGGFGRRNMFYETGRPGWMRGAGYAGPYPGPGRFAARDPEAARQALQRQAEFLQSELDAINNELSKSDLSAE